MVQANSERALPIEIACICEFGAPRLASLDTDILIWAEQQGYVVVSADVTCPRPWRGIFGTAVISRAFS